MPLPIVFPNPFDDADEINAAMMNALATALEAIGTPVVYRGTIFHDESTVISGSAIEMVFTSFSSVSVAYARQASPYAIGDEFKNGVFLSADTYTMIVSALRNTASGIVTWYVNDVVVGTTDIYFGGSDYEDLTIAGIVITEAGWQQIRGEVTSKHASSTNYAVGIIKISFVGSNA